MILATRQDYRLCRNMMHKAAETRNPKGRRSIRLKGFDYSNPGAYFVTICVQNKKCIFGRVVNGTMVLNRYGKLAEQKLKSIPHRHENTAIHHFIVMPNHVHAIIEIYSPDDKTVVGVIHELPLPRQLKTGMKERRTMLIPMIVGEYKMQTAKEINHLRNNAGERFWQRNYYEHILRNDADYDKCAEYIRNNPLTWTLEKN